MYKRYAVYYTPHPGTPLAVFGASWLGWDSAAGKACVQPGLARLDVEEITATPRKYGFHGTIKPPFRLAEGTTADALSTALEKLCADAAPVSLEGLTLARLGRFLALVPTGDTTALAALAARAVQELDVFRAPPTEADLTRRRAHRLTPAQDGHLTQWGYPYVLDQFRFHLTLTRRLDKVTAAIAQDTLASPLSTLDLSPFQIPDLTLLVEDETGGFHQIGRYPLLG